MRNPDSRKAASGSYDSASRKRSRKGENPTRFALTMELSSKFGLTCKNSACRAVLPIDDAFCKRCSCCLCRQFDDNKDPSLWLVCGSESAPRNSCGLSCHIECAFQQGKVGVANLGESMQLDGSHWCASCGKVSPILGCWKKQLVIAKYARRTDVLCHRIFLSYRLLDGTSRFKELHEIVKEAKLKLEAEVGPLNGDSGTMSRGIVSRLAIASDVKKLCSLAIDKADEWLANLSSEHSNCTVDSLSTACSFLFEEVTSSSLVLVLIKLPTPMTDHIKGFKLGYWKSGEETFSKEHFVFSRESRRILIEKLQPCTEYTFRTVWYTEAGDLSHSEAKCFTKSEESVDKTSSPAGLKTENALIEGSSSNAAEHLNSNPAKEYHSSPVSRNLDLNVVYIPHLNEDLNPPLESLRDEDNVCTLEGASEPDDGDDFRGIYKDAFATVNGGWPSDDSQVCALTQNGDVLAVDSLGRNNWKRASSTNKETCDGDNTLIKGSSFRDSSRPDSLDENFENCVKVIRWLECQGHIKPNLRLKLLTWFSLRSTEQERRVIHSFIVTHINDPKILARQIVDSFGDVISCKKPRSYFE